MTRSSSRSEVTTVWAGGGVILRDGCLLVVHRSRYDDWSLPKGKLEPGETWEQAALREVEEETGLVCTLGEEVGMTRYLDGRGRDKLVRYFRMSADGEPRPCNEVDEVRWVPLTEAAGFLTHAPEVELLAGLA
jgi:8-oxo-dGTP diphosphatase